MTRRFHLSTRQRTAVHLGAGLLAILSSSAACGPDRDGEPLQRSEDSRASEAGATSAPEGLTGPEVSLWSSADVPSIAAADDDQAVELGVKFRSSVGGQVTGIRFYKGPGNSGAHIGHLWTAAGEPLASVEFTGESASGWQEARFAAPVAILANHVYVASYFAPNGRYAASNSYFSSTGHVNGALYALEDGESGGNGVYHYGSAELPTSTWRGSNYWVDVLFVPEDAPPRGGSLNLPLVPWEGGPAYYGAHPYTDAAGWDDPEFFPIGVWYEGVYSQGDIDLDRDAGINTYVELTSGSDLALIRQNGMFAVAGIGGMGSETVGHMLTDEADMWAGPGDAAWTGNSPGQGDICSPASASCGYTVMQTLVDHTPPDGRVRYANYGKGVMLWESVNQAQRFVNTYTEVVSNDIYWYTDPNICGEMQTFLGLPSSTCRLSANYGVTMDKMRQLDGMDGKRQPIWAFGLGRPPGPEPRVTARAAPLHRPAAARVDRPRQAPAVTRADERVVRLRLRSRRAAIHAVLCDAPLALRRICHPVIRCRRGHPLVVSGLPRKDRAASGA
ncbi:uncharacterized protein SOCE26_103360 [Sorangium cellulosum]|uniref:DUF4082 domain-containing protein n=1 Tax=Sorangium cellulosum TaxID=56 RepID=A0A2L0FB24_SORCE|nr:DUF4082 domain-containing protein [Sorangium cellulosum]AUX48795.1 uncharacterized protein SOCE26_103360 [Sorangium cellulosum]